MYNFSRRKGENKAKRRKKAKKRKKARRLKKARSFVLWFLFFPIFSINNLKRLFSNSSFFFLLNGNLIKKKNCLQSVSINLPFLTLGFSIPNLDEAIPLCRTICDRAFLNRSNSAVCCLRSIWLAFWFIKLGPIWYDKQLNSRSASFDDDDNRAI